MLNKSLSGGDKGNEMLAKSVEMRVEEAGELVLSYVFRTLQEAAEMFAFLKDFFPDATFLIHPVRH